MRVKPKNITAITKSIPRTLWINAGQIEKSHQIDHNSVLTVLNHLEKEEMIESITTINGRKLYRLKTAPKTQ